MCSIVGDADGGVPLSDAEYAEFKRKAELARGVNRIYVSWRCLISGIDCKLIGLFFGYFITG